MNVKWIPVEKELPENMFPVLIWIDYPEEDEYEVAIAFHCVKDGCNYWRFNDYEGTVVNEYVKAWMPLPKPILEE